jgi:hypothetical protein
LELGFDSTGEEDSAVFNDFAFVQTHSHTDDHHVYRDMIIVASGTENQVALVDMTKGYPMVTKITLSTSTDLTARSNRRRQVEWVRGTPFVWIDGTDTDEGEVYVINVDTKSLVRTITGVKTTKMLNVENYERKHTMDLIQNLIGDQMDTITSTDNNQGGGGGGSSSATANKSNMNDDNDIDPVGIVGLIIGLVACFVGAANMIFLKKVMAGLENSDTFADDDGKKSLTSSKMPV